MSKSDIEKAMEFNVAAYLPYDAKMFLGNESESRKLTDDKVARDLIKKTLLPVLQKSLTEITIESAEEGGEESGFLGNLLGKLKSKG
ncbi:MAG: hypothetical protein H6860_01400 [Rhodospirillales bacterium]|nr:hypothetical protein [Rhodospirillales bacterium]